MLAYIKLYLAHLAGRERLLCEEFAGLAETTVSFQNIMFVFAA